MIHGRFVSPFGPFKPCSLLVARYTHVDRGVSICNIDDHPPPLKDWSWNTFDLILVLLVLVETLD